jgi:hypothetical protein
MHARTESRGCALSKTRIKIPKRVAGVKIPKTVRKGPINDFINSTAGQMLLAEALMAAASLFAVKRINGEGAGEVLSHPVDSAQRAAHVVGARAGDAQEMLSRSTARLQFALAEAVRAFRTALTDPSAIPEPEPEVGKKKSRSSSDQSVPH